jgi:hypothetical protein
MLEYTILISHRNTIDRYLCDKRMEFTIYHQWKKEILNKLNRIFTTTSTRFNSR